MSSLKFIVSGGGTGGHIFPALSIADGLKSRFPDSEILFVGAEGKMEMEKVPAAGYPIIGLPVAGFHRGELWRNLLFIPKLIRAMLKARKVVRDFHPDAVIGVGGYASGPVLRVAESLGIPTVLQEQNSFAGVTNKILGKKAHKICVAYDKMERFFPASKIVFTGNPIRKGLTSIVTKSDEAKKYFNLTSERPVLLIVGGSLGARVLNQSVLANLDLLKDSDALVIWQTGKYYFADIEAKMKEHPVENIRVMEFISRMDLAYSLADIVVSRAGAGTISELCAVGATTILVPSPNVSEDHQTFNARALVEKEAAILITDSEAVETLIHAALNLLIDKSRRKELSENIKKLATPNATADIVEVIASLLNKGK
jgi:UDP-N-acetylglucosamine--N-acetylmuramyl-(pentapeptide) pyrophosphoryl-undecaprenol N-acetylglucosamine transferase